MVYFAPDDGRGTSEDEKAVLDRYQPQGEIYRVSVRTNNEYGEDVDVIDTRVGATNSFQMVETMGAAFRKLHIRVAVMSDVEGVSI
jgi:hypothetical protein